MWDKINFWIYALNPAIMCGINDTIQWIDCMQWTFKWHQCLPLPTAVGITQNIVLVALSSNVNSTVTIEWHTISLLALHPGGVVRSHPSSSKIQHSWKVAMASLWTAHCVIHVSLQYQNRSLSGLLTFISKGFRMEGRYKEISDTRGYDMLQRRQSRGHHVAINNTRHCFQPLLATSSRMQGEVAVFS